MEVNEKDAFGCGVSVEVMDGVEDGEGDFAAGLGEKFIALFGEAVEFFGAADGSVCFWEAFFFEVALCGEFEAVLFDAHVAHFEFAC